MEPTQEELSILSTAKPYTMTSGERLLHTIRTVRQLDKNNIKGDIVECGVWKGGHPIAAYLANTNTQRHFWLYDTFDGMTIPTQHDYKIKQKTSLNIATNTITSTPVTKLAENNPKAKRGFENWCAASLEEVRGNVNQFIPSNLTKYIKGDVVNTLQDSNNRPNKIALLRLDTDWYESTFAEIMNLYPKLSVGGIMVLDDYLTWEGSRKAFNEVFGDSLKIHTIDNKAVWVEKTHE